MTKPSDKLKETKTGTYIALKGGGEKCPRCGKNCYGHKSETKSYDEKGHLKYKAKIEKEFCTSCAHVRGDEL